MEEFNMKKLTEIKNGIARWDKTIYLWSASGKFIGMCKAEHNILLTAILKKKPEIQYISYGFDSYKNVIDFTVECDKIESLWDIYKSYIYFIPSNVKKIWVYDTKTNNKDYWITAVIIDRQHRIVFDAKTKTYFELFLIPRGYLVELNELSIQDILKYKLGREKEPIISINLPFEFPCSLFTSKKNTSEKSVILKSTNPNINEEFFRKSDSKSVIKKLEQNGFRFKKTKLYHYIMKM